MGLEALSRGAASCCFFESGLEVIPVLRRNIGSLGANAESLVVTGNAWSAATRPPGGSPIGLVFLDPPYSDSDDVSAGGAVRRYLARLAEPADRPVLVVLHHRADIRYVMNEADRWRITDHRIAGSHGITFFSL